jgi:phage terminase small subunit
MAEISVVPSALPQRPRPPASLPANAKRVWRAIVGDYRPGHFTAANLVLLEQFCMARALVAECDRRIGRRLLLKGRANPLLQVRGQAWAEVRACATKLRLAISSTVRAEAAAARPDENAGERKPWERTA